MGRFAALDVKRGSMPLQAYRFLLRLSIDASDETLRAYGADPSHRPNRDRLVSMWDAQAAAREVDETLRILTEFEDMPWSRELGRAYFRKGFEFVEKVDGAYRALDLAVDSGLLEITGWTDEGPEFGEGEQSYVDRASEEVFEYEPGVVPMFDPGADLNRSAYWGDGVEVRSRQSDVASRLLRSLPAFERATVDEVLDMRDELRGPVVRLRKFVDTVGEAAPSEVEAFDEYLDGLVRTEVDPALAELDELVRQDSYMRKLANGVTSSDHWIPAVGGIVLGVGGLSGAAALISGAAGVVSIPLRALYEHIAARDDQRSHPLYLLHHLGRR
ncbi:MAG: hypothetical protein M3P85_11780 [Actinomycetota bacterium]|nr:hypothetical protein [Actinomycetota bacterium]